jgi:DNA-binding FadR family transcriptional regulator
VVSSAEQILERITPADIAELREINDRLLEPTPIDEATETDFRFHTRLISVLGNRAIRDVYLIMKPVILRIMKKGKTRHTFGTMTQTEHAAIIDALESGDRLAYQYRMKSHLEYGFAHFSKETGAATARD